MTSYARGRQIHDADSHLLEPADWLHRYVSPRVRDSLAPLDLHGLEAHAARAVLDWQEGRRARYASAEQLMGLKNWDALGAFDPQERALAVDLLGFRSQLVFSTYSHHGMIDHGGAAALAPEVLYEMVDGHNRGVADFCAGDARLLGVGFISPHDPARAAASTRLALELGCAGIEVPSLPCGGYSISHPALYPIYEMLEGRGAPLLFHVGGGGRLVHPTFAANGREPERLYHDRETLLPSLTYIGIPAPVEMALAALIFDGVFERFPGLRCGVIEQGAAWVPGFLRRLDAALEQFGRPRQREALPLRPSEYFHRQVRVTPFPFENIDWLIGETGCDLYMFGTDYPHDEGGEKPLEMFDATLERLPPEVSDAIYWRNFEFLMGDALPATLRVRDASGPASDDRAAVEDEVLRLTGEPLAIHRKKVLLRLLVNDAAGRLGVAASDEEVQEAVDEFRVNCGLYDVDETLEWMSAEGVTDDSLSRVMRDGVLTNKLYRRLSEQVERELPDHVRVSTGRRWQLRRPRRT